MYFAYAHSQLKMIITIEKLYFKLLRSIPQQ